MKPFTLLKHILISLLASAALCSNAMAAEKTVIIAQAIDLSGPNGSTGRDYVAGITTYFDSVNMQGGINGKRIQYIVQDDKGDPALSGKLAGELSEKADYLIGGIGAEATSAVLANASFKHSGQILFAPLASPSKEASNRALFWRPSQEQEIDYIFSWFDKLGIHDVGIAYQEGTNQQLLAYVQSMLAKRKLRLAGTAKIMKNPQETAHQAQLLAAQRPNLVISLADSIGTGLFLRQFRKHAERTFVAGTSLINLPTLTEVAGANATEWTVFSQVVPNPTVGTSSLQTEHLNMMRRFRDEEVSSMTLEGFAVAKSLLKAIQMSKGGNLHAFMTHKASIDLGGLIIFPPSASLSSFVDIALLRRGRSLMF